jgi:peptidoglycan/LPS O-acetylase OafA/YrhL
VLAGRGWQRAGAWSFAFFLMHVPVLQALTALLPERPGTIVAGLGWSVAAFGVSWVLAAVVYRTWEEPGRRAVLRRAAPRREPERVPVAA